MKRIVLVLLLAFGLGTTAGFARGEGTEQSGTLHVKKECSQYNPAVAFSFCTITSSNIDVIKKGMRVVYVSAANLKTGRLNSDLVIDGPGYNLAFGHVRLNLKTLTGVVTLSGGTGRFTNFHAGPLTVACPHNPVCSWVGPYWFSSGD